MANDASAVGSDATERRTTRTNVLALVGDFVFFSIGFAFYDPLVVVPAFANEFTGSALLVGLLSTLRVLMITVPQIWAASVLEARPRAKPLLIASSIGGRVPILLLSIAVLLWADTQMELVTLVLALAVMLFFTSEGLNGVSWPALVGKVVPEGFRGRFFGLGQLLASFGSLTAGFFVNRILDLQSLGRSGRWSLLFFVGFVWLMISVLSMVFIREKPTPHVSEARKGPGKPDIRESLRKAWIYLREDRWLRRVILVQLVISTPAATFAFFVVRARQTIPDAATMIGTFVMLQSVGSAAAALIGGTLIDRVGSWATIRVAAAVEVLALAAVTLGGVTAAALPFYFAAFFLMGFVNGASWWSFSAYLLDLAPEAKRPIYLATNGILASVTALNPVIAGALFEALQPEILFGGASLLAVAGFALAWTLRHGIASKTVAGG
ncbi:MAG: hypothetical protein MUF84_04610 [Anaerolineae bacterium]|jgi:MFS family permease|nr:hypothetical protein [Anaerolineae bacterium]